MSNTLTSLGLFVALSLSLNGEVVAQDGDHDAVNHEEMNHEEMNHEEMNHEEMNHEEMNHEEMNHEEMNHEEMNHEEMNHEEMDHSAMTEMENDSLRDPHAYSGGYERATGPYSLPAQRQVVLADEATFVGVWMDRFELVDHEDGQGAELEGFAWLGNSYRRLLLQAQIETVEGEVEEGEIDLLYSRAVSPFWDLRAGLHHSFGESADRDWAAIGFKGLAPYWFEVDAALHLGDHGRTAFDLELEYELLLTQRLVLQPRLDIAVFGKTDIELGRGSGLSTIKAGARLRYEFDRQFAPYLGVERVRRFGETAELLPLGSSRTETHWVLGLRFWY
jgi:copper resistance protein B